MRVCGEERDQIGLTPVGTAAGMPVGLSGGRSAGNSWVWVGSRPGKTWLLLCNLGRLGNFSIQEIKGKDVSLSVLKYIIFVVYNG